VLAISLTLQLRGASVDQSCNAIILPCNVNIIKSLLSTPEHQQVQLFLLSIHHRHLYAHSTIFHCPGTKFKSGWELPLLHWTKHL